MSGALVIARYVRAYNPVLIGFVLLACAMASGCASTPKEVLATAPTRTVQSAKAAGVLASCIQREIANARWGFCMIRPQAERYEVEGGVDIAILATMELATISMFLIRDESPGSKAGSTAVLYAAGARHFSCANLPRTYDAVLDACQ